LETEMRAVWGESTIRRFRPQETFMIVDVKLPDPYIQAGDGSLVPIWDSMNGVVFLPEYAGNPDSFESAVFPLLFNRLMGENRAGAHAEEFHEALRAYLHRTYEGGEGPLLDLKRYRAPATFDLVNQIYARSDEAQFRAFLKDYFGVLNGGQMNPLEREAAVRQLLSEAAGGRP